ncbi:RNA polymerase sporulation sigma factor SigK [Coprococcus catus]|uniref:RNA polymerase sporulation sigma factor SigK n=1 Tax=Coprococcus catus TaxID=116085 RepID=UPI0015C0EBE6|nr:RNA polymerase sporulation sigma factor SigK [Coprococcus catus]MBT9772027.1 sigma-70 family RNA polymerase sigma factor [Coprococcus catus]MBX9230919.1 RNA polymerase sporulation sigma factor SigK [Coprococcus catus]MCT6799928.1 RNA polymerase sporulation sigma factor SigK [Coprococcus catus]
MQSFPQPLSAAQEASYLRQYQNGDMHARDILIERNLRLVAHIVKKYIHSGKETDELISIGIIGLVKAVNTYNFDKGSRLATYAARCIDNELLMLMRGDKKRSREVSLYDPIGTDKEGNEITLLSIIEHNNEDVVEQLARKQSLQKLSKIISEVLTPREYFVVIRRYGLFGHSESTQRELASQLNISRSYVSRIEKKALEKLRHHLD